MQIYSSDSVDGSLHVRRLTQSAIEPEAELVSILHRTPRLIADEPLFIIGRQVSLDSGVPDLLACDQHGNVVVCEVKIGRSGTGSASEETILSQPQTYASSVSRFDYDQLDAIYQDYCERLADGEWTDDRADVPGGTLQSGLETVFGVELDPHEFNTEQRLVVVAEEITERTAASARFLLEQGLHFQCTEVRRFALSEDSTDDQHLLATDVVVDYDEGRIRPKDRPSPTYPELAELILAHAFPSFQSLVEAESVDQLLSNGFDTREHRLHSNNPAHPASVVYRLGIAPDQGSLLIGIDITGDDEQDESYERIQTQSEVFAENGFEVTGNQQYRVVVLEWSLDDPQAVRDSVEEIADRFADLVRLGHNVLVDVDAQ